MVHSEGLNIPLKNWYEHILGCVSVQTQIPARRYTVRWTAVYIKGDETCGKWNGNRLRTVNCGSRERERRWGGIRTGCSVSSVGFNLTSVAQRRGQKNARRYMKTDGARSSVVSVDLLSLQIPYIMSYGYYIMSHQNDCVCVRTCVCVCVSRITNVPRIVY